MTPEKFLEFARDMANIKKQPDGTYFIYDYGAVKPFYHAKRVPEVEKQLGPKALVLESIAFDPTPYGHIVYDVYFIQEGLETTLEFMMHEDHVLSISALKKRSNWLDEEISKVENEKQIILNYLYEDPRYRLLFATGAMKIEEE